MVVSEGSEEGPAVVPETRRRIEERFQDLEEFIGDCDDLTEPGTYLVRTDRPGTVNGPPGTSERFEMIVSKERGSNGLHRVRQSAWALEKSVIGKVVWWVRVWDECGVWREWEPRWRVFPETLAPESWSWNGPAMAPVTRRRRSGERR